MDTIGLLLAAATVLCSGILVDIFSYLILLQKNRFCFCLSNVYLNVLIEITRIR